MKFFIVLLYKATYGQIRENSANTTLLTNHTRHFDKPVIMWTTSGFRTLTAASVPSLRLARRLTIWFGA